MIETTKPYYHWFLWYNRHFIIFTNTFLEQGSYSNTQEIRILYLLILLRIIYTCVTSLKNTRGTYSILDMHFFKIKKNI